MTLRRTVSPLMMMMMVKLLDFTKDIWTLPAPSRVSMDSVDMRHTLRWLPLQAACNTTVLYSVQYQGEFELLQQNGRWVDAAECRRIPSTHCDLTFDLGSDSDYNLRVRARCGRRLSAWTELGRPFNRRDTVLMVPEITVTTAGDALQVSFDKLPPTATVSVTVWKKGDELQAAVYSVAAEQSALHVAALQEGAVYCVTARAVLDSKLRRRSSSSTHARCVSITGPDAAAAAAWKRPTTVTLTVVFTAGLLLALFWSIVHCRPDTCQAYFHKEPMPQSLKGKWDIRRLTGPQEDELCERISAVLGVEPEQNASETDAAFATHSGDQKY